MRNRYLNLLLECLLVWIWHIMVLFESHLISLILRVKVWWSRLHLFQFLFFLLLLFKFKLWFLECLTWLDVVFHLHYLIDPTIILVNFFSQFLNVWHFLIKVFILLLDESAATLQFLSRIIWNFRRRKPTTLLESVELLLIFTARKRVILFTILLDNLFQRLLLLTNLRRIPSLSKSIFLHNFWSFLTSHIFTRVLKLFLFGWFWRRVRHCWSFPIFKINLVYVILDRLKLIIELVDITILIFILIEELVNMHILNFCS